jgi:hypothetical protein
MTGDGKAAFQRIWPEAAMTIGIGLLLWGLTGFEAYTQGYEFTDEARKQLAFGAAIFAAGFFGVRSRRADR